LQNYRKLCRFVKPNPTDRNLVAGIGAARLFSYIIIQLKIPIKSALFSLADQTACPFSAPQALLRFHPYRIRRYAVMYRRQKTAGPILDQVTIVSH
jgi:hypothetical protein